jgi:hypothetical protein
MTQYKMWIAGKKEIIEYDIAAEHDSEYSVLRVD